MRGGVGAEELHSSGSNREEEALDGLAGRGDPDVEDETRGGGGRERMDGTSHLKTRVRLFK